ncbi:unnamed protein product [Leuciscus chuanchicus]
MSAHIPDTCVARYSCGTVIALWIRGGHPTVTDGVVTRSVCGDWNNYCCLFGSFPIRVKACPGNYYVYELVSPTICYSAYCADTGSINTSSTTVTPVTISPDPCYNYTVLNDTWRSINNGYGLHSYYNCDAYVSWSGWYRLFINGLSAQIPDTCVAQYSCGTHAPLWIRGGHPTVTDGVVTRDVCGHWNNYCCYFGSFPIKVKACPGNYYVYELVSPALCHSAYCADTCSINNSSTTVTPVTISPEKKQSFHKCADPCPGFFRPGDTHDLCVLCLGEEHAREALERASCANCESFSLKTLRSRLTLFSREEGSASEPHGTGPARAEAQRRLSSWGSQMELADRLESGVHLLDSSSFDEGELQVDDDVLSLSPNASAAAALPDGQDMVDDAVSQVETESSRPSCPVYAELVEVMGRATDTLQLPWRRVREETARGRLDDRFLPSHRPPAQVSLPFLPDLHNEIKKAWKNPFSARIHPHQRGSFAAVDGIAEHGYVPMPPVDETLANYLVSGQTSTLRAPTLPSKPLKTSSRLNGRANTAAGQAGAALHTLAVLQAYQADLLRDLDQGTGLSPEAVTELCRTTDLALRATKQSAAAIGRSMAAMVVTERHLWLNLADIGEK